MAIKTIDDANLTAIADAIRAKGVEGSWKPSEMAPAIASIQSGGNTTDKFSDIEEIYKTLRGNLPPLLDAKEAYDKFGKDPNVPALNMGKVYYVYTGLILKNSQAICHLAYGTTILGYYDNAGEFVIEYNAGYHNTVASFSSSNYSWHDYNGHQYLIYMFMGQGDTFSPYLGSTTNYYNNNFKNLVDLDIYYNESMSSSDYYFKRFDLVYPELRFLRIVAGPQGKYSKDISSDSDALYNNASGKLQVVRDCQIGIYSSANGIYIYSPCLVGMKGLYSAANMTLYGTAFIPTAAYTEIGPVTMRSPNTLPLASSGTSGKTREKVIIQNTKFTSSISLSNKYYPIDIEFLDCTNSSTSSFISDVSNIETLINLGKTLPQYNSVLFKSNIIKVNSYVAVPVSLYQKELQPLFDKGWTISGGR